MLKQIPSEARCARASDFERSRAWFKRAMKREARACFEARIVALEIIIIISDNNGIIFSLMYYTSSLIF